MILKSFFYMPRSDRRAILALAIAALVAAITFGAFSFLPDSTEKGRGPTATTHRKGVGKQKAKSAVVNEAYAEEYYDDGPPRHVETFDFDPNVATPDELLRLGLQPWQVRAVVRYRNRGGVYRRKEDFARTYGLTVGDYRRLEPHIHIGSDYRPAAELAEVRRPATVSADASADPRPLYAPKLRQGEHLDVNTSDTTQLMKVPGIGSYFARQIVRLRDRLGGIADVGQLREIDDFPAEAMPYITVDRSAIRRLNVNTMSLQQLKRHPYINYYQARAIVDYRRLHGDVHSIDELAGLNVFSTDDIKRLAPYLTFSQ